jgi:hypothetical protein
MLTSMPRVPSWSATAAPFASPTSMPRIWVCPDLGLPGIAFVQDPLDYETRSNHTNMDTVERLSPPDLAQAAVVEAIVGLNSANRDGLLPRATHE